MILEPLIELLNLILPPLIGLFTQIIDKIMPVLQSVFSSVASLLSGQFKTAFDTIGDIFTNIKNIFQNIIDFVRNVFTGNWKSAWENVRNIFSNIWDSLKTIVKIPINYIINGINTLINGINKISFDVPNWVPGIGGKTLGFNIPNIPKLRRGLDFVPYDNYPALLHKGEQVLTASEKRERDKEIEEKKIENRKNSSIVVKVDIHIEHFEQNTGNDIDEFVDDLMYRIEEKIREKKETFE